VPLESTQKFLSELSGVIEKSDYWTARCPAHDDNENSLSISETDDGKTLIKCHAGCDTVSVVHSVGMTMRELFPDHGRPQNAKPVKYPGEKLVAKFEYQDADGAVLFRACRYERDEQVDGKTVRRKRFEQQRPNGQGGWISNMKGVQKVPYRLPEVIASSQDTPVLILEGEKLVDLAYEMGFVATCNVGGAGKNKWLKSYSQHLRDRNVIILPDNDKAGWGHEKEVRESLQGIARSVKTLELPGLEEKDDIEDWYKRGGTAEQLSALIAGLSDSEPENPFQEQAQFDLEARLQMDRKIVERLGLHVLGMIGDHGSVKVYSEFHEKTEVIRDVDRLSYARILQICGPRTREFIYAGQDDPPDGMFRVRDVKEAIATLSGFHKIDEMLELGDGIWRVEAENGVPVLVMVNANKTGVFRDGKLHRHHSPRFGNQIIDLDTREPWANFDRISDCVSRFSPEWSQAITARTEDWLASWIYGHQDESPALLTGMILATWLQTAWRWRPQIAVIGESASGKSSLFELLCGSKHSSEKGIFGNLAIKSSAPSAAGIRQYLGNSAKIVIADELEQNRHRQEILNMLRMAGQGDSTLRGTTGKQSGMEFTIKHIVWIGSTESGIQKDPDANRFIMVELKKPNSSQSGNLPRLTSEEKSAAGIELLAIALQTFGRASYLVNLIRERKPADHDIRIIESYAVPAATYSAAMGLDDDQAIDTFQSVIKLAGSREDRESDQEILLNTILESILHLPKGEKMSVANAIAQSKIDMEVNTAMETCGVGVFSDTGTETVFFSSSTVKRHLLRGTDYERINIGEILKRLPGAVENARRHVGGNRTRGTEIPLKVTGIRRSSDENGF
jgi:5S rRNA maturation endonuclease (ribonuclease M5)